MTAYELMIKTNHYLIKGGELTEPQKANITGQLLAARSPQNEVERFQRSMKDAVMYPSVYIPPYKGGEKYQTVIPMSPKTHILSANSYELEILRLLHMFAGQNGEVCDMIGETVTRLKKSCFGYQSCGYGECFESSVIALRFIAVVAPDDTEWQKKQIAVFNKHFKEKRRSAGVLHYYWLCLSELPLEVAASEILSHRENILIQLSRNKTSVNETQVVVKCVMENTLARLPEHSLTIQ